MQYRHVKTGKVIETNSKITGANWEPVKTPSKWPAKRKGTPKK